MWRTVLLFTCPATWWQSSPLTYPLYLQTHMWSSPCWTPKAKKCPSVRRRCAAASPTHPIRRRSCSRWRSSNSLRCHWSWRCSAPAAAWGPGRGWAGSLWASTAPARSSRPTGQRWKRLKVSRSATGTHSPSHKVRSVSTSVELCAWRLQIRGQRPLPCCMITL